MDDYSDKKQGENLGDKELSAVTGGYIPFFDECLQRYDWEKCYHGATIFNAYEGCPNCKLVATKKGRDYNTMILSCTKGYFSNVEGPETRDELIK